MTILTVHFANIHNQACFILQTQNQEKLAIVKDNVVCLIDEYEFEYSRPSVTSQAKYYGYLGYLISSTAKISYYHAFVKSATKIGTFSNLDLYKITELCFFNSDKPNSILTISEKTTYTDETLKVIADFTRLVTNGLFYFAYDFKLFRFHDLSISFDRTHENTLGRNYYCWNRGMLIPFRQATLNFLAYITPIINGSIEMQSLVLSTVHLIQPAKTQEALYKKLLDLQDDSNTEVQKLAKQGDVYIKILLISRLSWARAGTRFMVRGVNDDGFVANLVETQQVILVDNVISCFTQLRGSVPLFWSQNSLAVGSHKFDYTRERSLNTAAFNRHFERLIKDYYNVCILSLLSTKKDEGVLNKLYKDIATESKLSLSFYHMDFHASFSNTFADTNWNEITDVKYFLFKSMFHLSIIDKNPMMICNQKGIIRTNCVDCLDRTNSFQTFIALNILEKQLYYMGLVAIDSITLKRFQDILKNLWFVNGNSCSQNYAGTDALDKNKSTVQSFFKDTHTSIKRAIISNFTDYRRHAAISRLCNINQPLYLFQNPFQMAGVTCIPDIIRTNSCISHELLYELTKNVNNFTETQQLKIHVGTWNVAGGCERITDPNALFTSDVQEWLLDSPKLNTKYHLIPDSTPEELSDFDLIVIGLEEMVDLTASNILYYNDEQMMIWRKYLTALISRDSIYELITSIQLVGVCLFIFSKVKHVEFIKEVSTSYVKTGLGGTAGNKGGVGISLKLYNSLFCFVCAHFAAGNTYNNVQQRMKDFNDISQQLLFDRDRNIYDHDYIFWVGDLNYRININYDVAKTFAHAEDIQRLLCQDQLIQGMRAQRVFENFNEGKIKFLPTYKYDFFSTAYDTSEKARTPSYTDRILWWQSQNPILIFSNGVLQYYYGRSECVVSDHRPVSSVFHVSVRVLDLGKFNKYYSDLINKSKYGQITIQYFLTMRENSKCDISYLIDELRTILPDFSFYRFESNVISITFSYISDFSKIPQEINILVRFL